MSISYQITLSDTQVQAMEMLNENAADMILNATYQQLRYKMLRHRNGNPLAAEKQHEATHSIRTTKNGKEKVTYYKGGLKEAATVAFKMAQKFLPKDITLERFVRESLTEVDFVIAGITAQETEWRKNDKHPALDEDSEEDAA